MKKGLMYPLTGIIAIAFFIIISSNYKRNWEFNWQGFNEMIIDSVKNLENYNHVIIKSDYAVRKAPKIPKLTNWIIKNSTIEELERLTDYPNGAVKITAYEGLMTKTSGKQRLELIIKAINDSVDKVYFSDGHSGGESTIGLYLVYNLLNLQVPPNPPFPPDSRKDYGLSENEKIKISEIYSNQTN